MSRQDGKVFIGGLSWETTDDKLKRYFENFGTVQEAFVSYDRHTGRPRGFGFVVFADPLIADKVAAQQHTIDRREVEAKKALPKDESPVSKDQQAVAQGHRTKKIFVGGLAPTVDEETFRGYFAEFGEVEDAVVMYDHENKRPRGFGFITFTEEEAVEKVFAQGTMQTIHEKQIEIKRAVPRDSMPPSPRAFGPPHHHHPHFHPDARGGYYGEPRHYGGGRGGYMPRGGYGGGGYGPPRPRGPPGYNAVAGGPAPPQIVTGIPAHMSGPTPAEAGMQGVAQMQGMPQMQVPMPAAVAGGGAGGYVNTLPNGIQGQAAGSYGLDAQQAAAQNLVDLQQHVAMSGVNGALEQLQQQAQQAQQQAAQQAIWG